MNMFKPSDVKTPEEYIASLSEPRRSEIQKIHDFIKKTVPDLKAYIEYGMIGYGQTPYKSKSGKEGTWFVVGLASQKNYISIYICVTKDGKYLAEQRKDVLGKSSIGRSCIRYKKLEDIPFDTFKDVLQETDRLYKSQGIFQ